MEESIAKKIILTGLARLCHFNNSDTNLLYRRVTKLYKKDRAYA